MIKESLSPMSLAKVKEAADWNDLDLQKDPLRLWKRIIKTHDANTDSNVPAIIKQKARDSYNDCRQLEKESITAYKKKFD